MMSPLGPSPAAPPAPTSASPGGRAPRKEFTAPREPEPVDRGRPESQQTREGPEPIEQGPTREESTTEAEQATTAAAAAPTETPTGTPTGTSPTVNAGGQPVELVAEESPGEAPRVEAEETAVATDSASKASSQDVPRPAETLSQVLQATSEHASGEVKAAENPTGTSSAGPVLAEGRSTVGSGTTETPVAEPVAEPVTVQADVAPEETAGRSSGPSRDATSPSAAVAVVVDRIQVDDQAEAAVARVGPDGARGATEPKTSDLGTIAAREAVTASAPVEAAAPRPAAPPPVLQAAQRIGNQLDQLQDAPPPRSMTLELTELEGVRVRVSLQGAAIRVSILDGSIDQAQRTQLSAELDQALAEQGFELAGEDDQRRREAADNARGDFVVDLGEVGSASTRPADDRVLRI